MADKTAGNDSVQGVIQEAPAAKCAKNADLEGSVRQSGGERRSSEVPVRGPEGERPPSEVPEALVRGPEGGRPTSAAAKPEPEASASTKGEPDASASTMGKPGTHAQTAAAAAIAAHTSGRADGPRRASSGGSAHSSMGGQHGPERASTPAGPAARPTELDGSPNSRLQLVRTQLDLVAKAIQQSVADANQDAAGNQSLTDVQRKEAAHKKGQLGELQSVLLAQQRVLLEMSSVREEICKAEQAGEAASAMRIAQLRAKERLLRQQEIALVSLGAEVNKMHAFDDKVQELDAAYKEHDRRYQEHAKAAVNPDLTDAERAAAVQARDEVEWARDEAEQKRDEAKQERNEAKQACHQLNTKVDQLREEQRLLQAEISRIAAAEAAAVPIAAAGAGAVPSPFMERLNSVVRPSKPYLASVQQHQQFLQSTLVDDVLSNPDPQFVFYPIAVRQIWIRRHYRKLLEALELEQEAFASMAVKGSMKNFAITGTPGVGKSLFGVYLLYCVVNNLVAVHESIKNVVFVQIVSTSDSEPDAATNRLFAYERRGEGQWAPASVTGAFKPALFIYDASVKDTGQKDQQYINGFISARNILIYSPRMTWSSSFSKITGGIVPREKIMPLWSEDELVKAAPFVRPDLAQVEIEARYCVVGGSARHIFSEASATSRFLRESATNCTPTALLALVQGKELSLVGYFQAGRGVGALVHIQVAAPYTVEAARYEFASLEAAAVVFEKLSAVRKSELDTVLHKFLQNKLSGGLCGPLVGCKMYSQLVSEGATVHVTDLHNGAKMLVKFPAANDGHACRYRNLSAVDPAQRFYYQPAKANEGAIDVIMPPRVCLQSTISDSHPIAMDRMKEVAHHLLAPFAVQVTEVSGKQQHEVAGPASTTQPMPEITLDQLRERYPDKVLLLFVVYVAGDAKAGGVKTLQSFTRGGIVTDTHIAEVRQFRLEAPVFTL